MRSVALSVLIVASLLGPAFAQDDGDAEGAPTETSQPAAGAEANAAPAPTADVEAYRAACADESSQQCTEFRENFCSTHVFSGPCADSHRILTTPEMEAMFASTTR